MAWPSSKNTHLGIPEDLVVLKEDVLQRLCQVLVVDLHTRVATVIIRNIWCLLQALSHDPLLRSGRGLDRGFQLQLQLRL